MGFFIIYVSLSILKISRKSETWSPEPVRFAMEHALYVYLLLLVLYYSSSVVCFVNSSIYNSDNVSMVITVCIFAYLIKFMYPGAN